jgi:polyisoprenoid-binding protein YceI
MKKTLLFLLTYLLLINVSAQDKLSADAAKTKIEWLGERIINQHTGTINLLSGWLSWQDNKIIAGEFSIDMASLKDSQANARLENHLKSDDFFGVEKFPVAKLVITGSTPFDKGYGVVSGNLTVKGNTNPIEFKAAMQKKDDGNWFYANIIVDRTKFDVRYGSGSFFDNLGDKTIFDEFKLKVSLLVN